MAAGAAGCRTPEIEVSACVQDRHPRWLWIQGSELEVGSARGTYKLYSGALVNGLPLWSQQGGRHWLFADEGGLWRLGRRLRTSMAGSTRLWLSARKEEGDEWMSERHEGRLPWEVELRWLRINQDACSCAVSLKVLTNEAATTAAHGSAAEASLDLGPRVEREDWLLPAVPPATAAEGAAFVSSMQGIGMKNWVVHNGQVINLEDPRDVAKLDDSTFAHLVEQSTRGEVEGTQGANTLPVPLQLWEVEKLLSVASQVTTALRSGRYIKDFGEILVKQLGGWAGDEAWAQEEQRRLGELVEEDGKDSRERLLSWVEDSLVRSLREVMKEFNRGQLAGASSSGSSAAEAPAAAARNSAGASADAGAAPADADELALQAALKASLEDPGVASGRNMQGIEREALEELWELEEEDIGCSGDEVWEALGSESGEEEPGNSQPAAQSSGCGHACDLPGGCCLCVVRAPRPGTVPGLVEWWQRCGVSHPPLGAPAAHLRFLCASCAAAEAGQGGKRWPLPFGGTLMLREGREVEELVCPAMPSSGAEVSWEDASSWVALDSQTLGSTGSEASWVLAS